MGGGHGEGTTYKGITIHQPKRWHTVAGKGLCAVMWFWVFYRAKQDGPVVVGGILGRATMIMAMVVDTSRHQLRKGEQQILKSLCLPEEEEEEEEGLRFGREVKREERMSYLLPHLHSGWAVDQAILSEEERVVVIRFGHDWDDTCMQMDEVLAAVAETIKSFAVIYLVDITEVPDFNTMYELYDPCTVMFFFRNKHIMIDLGTGNNNKINWALKDKQEFIDIVETVYRGARKGRGLVISPKDYSTKYRY
ncbi:hypothetical protein Ahy_B03g067779 [Arachis hypogaea]|uniref:Thioredoxin-like protein YLS8 n=5 Tax=Euphyllophyta TaxID=78536 RepID=A0A445A7S7_ARAHY|nr:hypothetical protein Ahy_B03g067779 [Arachis hypogaea]